MDVHVRHSEKLPLRVLLAEVQKQGFESAVYLPSDNKNDIREILHKEVQMYRNRFLVSLLLYLPIAVLMWIIPYSNSEFLTSYWVWHGQPAYVFMLMVLASVIQFFAGYNFYVGAYKSVRHGSANMDVLVVLATTSAWLYGVVSIFIPRPTEGVAEMQLHMEV